MKKLISFVLMTALFAGTVFAQGLPTTGGGGFTSPQSAATQGRLRSDADNFIRPDSFSGVRLTNWFGMASFESAERVSLGYATKLGADEEGANGVFFGAFYRGTFWNNVQTFGYTERNSPWLGDEKVVKNYSTLAFTANPLNQVAFLIGLADMGFRLTFTTTYQTFSDSDFIFAPIVPDANALSTSVKNFKTESGILAPQIAWSMTKNLTSNGIRPWATVDLIFTRNYTERQNYDGLNYAAGSMYITSSNNTFSPVLALGLGGLTIANKNSWRTSIDLDYTLTPILYNNDYSVYSWDVNGMRQSSNRNIKGEFTRGAWVAPTFVSGIPGGDDENDVMLTPGYYNDTLNERTYINHFICPSISTQWNGDRLRLRAKLNMDMNVRSQKVTPLRTRYNYSYDDVANEWVRDNQGVVGTHGSTQDISTFIFSPNLRLAMQWQLHQRLFLNAGARIGAVDLNVTTTKGDTYAYGVINTNSAYETKAVNYGNSNNQLTIGTTFNALDNLFLEAVSGATYSAAGGNDVSVFGTTGGAGNGLFFFSSILVGLRF